MNTYHRRFLTLEQRLLEKISAANDRGCELWTGRTSDGYGMISVGVKEKRVSRVLWEMRHGEIPSGICVLHKCDTPACCSDNHMFLGTHTDNMQDKRAKGRCPGPYKLTQQDVKKIFRLDRLGMTRKAIGRCVGVTGQHVGKILADGSQSKLMCRGGR